MSARSPPFVKLQTPEIFPVFVSFRHLLCLFPIHPCFSCVHYFILGLKTTTTKKFVFKQKWCCFPVRDFIATTLSFFPGKIWKVRNSLVDLFFPSYLLSPYWSHRQLLYRSRVVTRVSTLDVVSSRKMTSFRIKLFSETVRESILLPVYSEMTIVRLFCASSSRLRMKSIFEENSSWDFSKELISKKLCDTSC